MKTLSSSGDINIFIHVQKPLHIAGMHIQSHTNSHPMEKLLCDQSVNPPTGIFWVGEFREPRRNPYGHQENMHQTPYKESPGLRIELVTLEL